MKTFSFIIDYSLIIVLFEQNSFDQNFTFLAEWETKETSVKHALAEDINKLKTKVQKNINFGSENFHFIKMVFDFSLQ